MAAPTTGGETKTACYSRGNRVGLRQAGASSRELQAGSRGRPVSKIRAFLAQSLVSEFGLSLAEVAR